MTTAVRPATDEYPEAFARYVARVEEGEDVIAVLASQLDEVVARFTGIPEGRADYRYAPGKWSIKEMLGHLCDTERIFACRALRFARGDATPLPGFEENEYAPAMGAGGRTLADLAAEWADVRRATIALFRGIPEAAWGRRGVASGKEISVRALAYSIAGHVRHHLGVLDARYG